jgi:hypothetical protein
MIRVNTNDFYNQLIRGSWYSRSGFLSYEEWFELVQRWKNVELDASQYNFTGLTREKAGLRDAKIA